MIADLSRMFTDLIQGQLHEYFLWQSNLLEAVCTPDNDERALMNRTDGGSQGPRLFIWNI